MSQPHRRKVTRSTRAMIRILALEGFSDRGIVENLAPFVSDYSFSEPTVQRVLRNEHDDPLNVNEWDYCLPRFQQRYPHRHGYRPRKVPPVWLREPSVRKREPREPPLTRQDVTQIVAEVLDHRDRGPQRPPSPIPHPMIDAPPTTTAPPIERPGPSQRRLKRDPSLKREPSPNHKPSLKREPLVRREQSPKRNPSPSLLSGYLKSDPILIDDEEDDSSPANTYDEEVRQFLARLPVNLTSIHPQLCAANLGTARELFALGHKSIHEIHKIFEKSLPDLQITRRLHLVKGLLTRHQQQQADKKVEKRKRKELRKWTLQKRGS